VIQGWPLKPCSAFSVPAWKIPNAFVFFSFFLDQLLLVAIFIDIVDES